MDVRRAALVGQILPLALVLGCQGTPPSVRVGQGPAQAEPRVEERLAAEPTAAIDAIRGGEYAQAREILGQLVFREELAQARSLLGAGRPEEALLHTEAARELFPSDEAASLLDARARLALAEASVAHGRPFAREALLDALAAFERAGESAEARLGAARAAYLLGRGKDSLSFASQGMARLGAREATWDRLPQRTYAEAAYAAYAEERGDERGPSADRELYQTTEAALTSLLGRAPQDPWVFLTLASLYEWEGRPNDAREALARGLDHVPGDAAMVQRFAALAQESGDALGAFEALLARHPEIAEAHWYAAAERFERALAALETGDFQPEAFERAEAGFARCAELASEYAENCTSQRLLCRNGRGWCLYQLGDLDASQAAFSSMTELAERGLEWQLDGRLLSGVQGLVFCADAYHKRNELLKSAEIYEGLRRFVPSEVTYANNAGFLFRDVAYLLEVEGKSLCRIARGELTHPEAVRELLARAGLAPAGIPPSTDERAALVVAANDRLARARELMQKSADAYRAAAELAPDDVRIVNDAAVVHVYYLHSELERAKSLLERCIALGAEQIERGDLSQDALRELKNAWGDAYQNLGALLAAHQGDRALAIANFEKAASIGDPRPQVTELWLPYLRGELDPDDFDDLNAMRGWAAPCP